MSLCQTYTDLAIQTWRLMEKARSVSHQPLEETITDNNIIELKSRHSHEVLTTTYNRIQEANTGADWQWWFTNSKQNSWFGVRVQAKILKFKTDRFEELKYKNQTDVLINDAKNNGLVPLYCFYSQWPLSYNISTRNCLSIPNLPENYGCSIVDAYRIKATKNIRNSNTLSEVISNSFPWSCLVCCQNIKSGPNGSSLPNRVRSFIVDNVILQNSVDDITIPEIIDSPPAHIIALLQGEGDSYAIDDPNLSGAIVIIENNG